jgi:hypothetical protein
MTWINGLTSRHDEENPRPTAQMEQKREGEHFYAPPCAVVAKLADATDLESGGAPSGQEITLRAGATPVHRTNPFILRRDIYMKRGCFSMRRFPLVCFMAWSVRSESFILRPL